MYYMLVRLSINLWVCIPGIRNPKKPSAERRMTLILRKLSESGSIQGQQTDLKLDSLSFLTLITKLSAWIFPDSGFLVLGKP